MGKTRSEETRQERVKAGVRWPVSGLGEERHQEEAWNRLDFVTSQTNWL